MTIAYKYTIDKLIEHCYEMIENLKTSRELFRQIKAMPQDIDLLMQTK